jgi:hypothetical protein
MTHVEDNTIVGLEGVSFCEPEARSWRFDKRALARAHSVPYHLPDPVVSVIITMDGQMSHVAPHFLGQLVYRTEVQLALRRTWWSRHLAIAPSLPEHNLHRAQAIQLR